MFTQHKTSNDKKVNISMSYRLQIQTGTKVNRNLESNQLSIDSTY